MKNREIIKGFVLACILIYTPILLFSQGQTNNWYFSQHESLNWNTFPPQRGTGPIANRYSSATISDENGMLLFSTDGSLIYDENNQAIPNFKLLNTPVQSPANVVIVPLGVGKNKKYYVFACDAYLANTGTRKNILYQNDTSLYYTEISSLNGKPDFSKPLIRKKLAEHVYGSIAATFTHDGKSAWLATAKRSNFSSSDTIEFVTYRFTVCGLAEKKHSYITNQTPYIVANVADGNAQRLKFSPDGQKIALCSDEYYDAILLFSFNKLTGLVEYEKFIQELEIGDVSLLFSKDSHFLYYQKLRSYNNDSIYLIKYDLISKKNIDSIVLWHPGLTPSFHSFFTMSQHTQGRMFFVKSVYFDIQANPNIVDWQMFELIDDGTDFKIVEQDYWKLRTDKRTYTTNFSTEIKPFFSYTNFTNFVESYFDPSYVTPQEPKPSVNRVCIGDSTVFTTTLSSIASAYYWIFGDGNTSTLQNPKHLYQQSGNYKAGLVVQYDCISDTIPLSVIVDNTPQITLQDKKVCNNSPVTVNAPSGYISYQWQNGITSSDSTFTTNGEETTINLKVTNACGSTSDQMQVSKIDISGINVFTPNHDGVNEYLHFDNPINDTPTLKVFNRWGKEIFKDNNYQNSWNADDVTSGMYYYELVYPGCDKYKSWLEIIK